MRYLTVAVAVAIIVVFVGAVQAENITIKGLTAYADLVGLDYAFYIGGGAAVELYKWTGSAWEVYARTTTGGDQGYYEFVDVDRDALCPSAPYFMVKVTGSPQTMQYWTGDFYSQARCAYALARPNGIPDAGIVRVDVFFVGDSPLADAGPQGYYEYNVTGRLAIADGDDLILPDMGPPAEFPAGSEFAGLDGANFVRIKGCRSGDWWFFKNWYISTTLWGQEETPTYAHATFYNVDLVPPAHVGDGYFCWSSLWPWWAMSGDDPDYTIVADFIDVELP